MNSSAFKSRPNRTNEEAMNHYFNGPGDGDNHGHVQEIIQPDGNATYPYVRDVEGNEYGD